MECKEKRSVTHIQAQVKEWKNTGAFELNMDYIKEPELPQFLVDGCAPRGGGHRGDSAELDSINPQHKGVEGPATSKRRSCVRCSFARHCGGLL